MDKNTIDVLIHSMNTSLDDLFGADNQIIFKESPINELDTQLNEDVEKLNEIAVHESVAFIKTYLGHDYLNFIGLRFAYHMRLSEHEKVARMPIVFISNETTQQLLKLSLWSGILATESVYMINESNESYHNFMIRNRADGIKKVANLNRVINRLRPPIPNNIESLHNLNNLLSLNRWADYLGSDSSNYIKASIHDKIGHDLYYKIQSRTDTIELKTKFSGLKFQSAPNSKVIFTDDQSELGWKYVIQGLFDSNTIVISPEIDKELSQNDLIEYITPKILEDDSIDVVIIDLKLHDSDQYNEIEHLTGVQLLKQIKTHNAGINVIAMSAASDQVIVNTLKTIGDSNRFNFDAYISKNDSPNTIHDHITRSISDGITKTRLLKPLVLALDKISDQEGNEYIKDSLLLEVKKWIEISKSMLINNTLTERYNVSFIMLIKAIESIKNDWLSNPRIQSSTGKKLKIINPEENPLKVPLETYCDRIHVHIKSGEHPNNSALLRKAIDYRNDYLHSNKPQKNKISIKSDRQILTNSSDFQNI
jgi:DNA-binding NarL/FixJ family response regulator